MGNAITDLYRRIRFLEDLWICGDALGLSPVQLNRVAHMIRAYKDAIIEAELIASEMETTDNG